MSCKIHGNEDYDIDVGCLTCLGAETELQRVRREYFEVEKENAQLRSDNDRLKKQVELKDQQLAVAREGLKAVSISWTSNACIHEARKALARMDALETNVTTELNNATL